MVDDDLADHFEWFATWADGTSPLYARLARGVADDADLLELARAAREAQPPAHLLFGAVHFHLLRGADHPLRRFYPSCVDDAIDPDAVDPFPAFREFALDRADDLRPVMGTRRVQTNAVRRCSALLPGFERVSRAVGREPLALVEVGPSAGLNLCWDRYGYDYGSFGTVGPENASCVLQCAVRGGDPPIPDSFPAVASRVGIDVNPLDVTDDADRDWLRALVWPDHTGRHRVLSAAVEVARRDPPELIPGDGIDLLPEVLDRIPKERPVCLFTTQVLYQFDDDARQRFETLVAEHGEKRELHWLSGDETDDDAEQAIVLRHARPGEPRGEGKRIATYQQHGEWLRWDA